MSRWSMLRISVAGASMVVFACTNGGPDDTASVGSREVCTPNQIISCACLGQGTGSQTCAADGRGYGECVGCPGVDDGCSSPNCDTCGSCFEGCLCQGNSPTECLDGCNAGGAGGTSGGASGGGGGGSFGGMGGGSAGGGASGGSGGAPVADCQSCVSQSCAGELGACASTSGCIELAECALSSGCALDDLGCVLLSCALSIQSVSSVGPALSLGACAAQSCGVECS